MNMRILKDTLSHNFYKSKMRIKKESPTILLVTGIAGGLAATYFACKATYELNAVLEEELAKKKLLEEKLEKKEITEEEHKEYLEAAHTKTKITIAKKYAPAVGIWVLSTAALVGGHKISAARLAAVGAALESVTASFNEYRKRNIEEKGEEYDRQLMFGEKVKETKVEQPDGTVKTEKTVIQGSNPIDFYHYVLDESSIHYEKHPTYNINNVKQVLEMSQRLLNRRGYLYLYEVLEQLDIKCDKKAMRAGWVIGQRGYEDICIGDVGIDRVINDAFREGRSKELHLFFNVLPDIASVMFPEQSDIQGMRKPA